MQITNKSKRRRLRSNSVLNEKLKEMKTENPRTEAEVTAGTATLPSLLPALHRGILKVRSRSIDAGQPLQKDFAAIKEGDQKVGRKRNESSQKRVRFSSSREVLLYEKTR